MNNPTQMTTNTDETRADCKLTNQQNYCPHCGAVLKSEDEKFDEFCIQRAEEALQEIADGEDEWITGEESIRILGSDPEAVRQRVLRKDASR